jgi:retron-type reverse transcriptase
VTWETYGKNLDENIRELSERLKRGAYRAKPVRRKYIAKADGSQRPLGIPTLEDKIVQRAMADVRKPLTDCPRRADRLMV